MSLAIKWGFDTGYEPTQGFIYFDAVTSLRESLTGTLSKFPIDGGGIISDHFTADNPTWSFSGIISGVDISYHARVVLDDIGNESLNSTEPPEAVKVNSKNSALLKFVPDVVGQFFKPSKPEIVMAAQSADTILTIKQTLRDGFKNPTPVTLFEYDLGNLRKNPITNLIMTNIEFNEDADSGDALYCDITLEQATFTKTNQTQIPEGISKALVSENIADAAAATSNKGTQDSTAKPVRDQSLMLQGTILGKEMVQGVFE